MNKFICAIAVAVIAAGFTMAAYAQTEAPHAMDDHHGKGHPEVHGAIAKLEHAKADLQKAAHDYEGHRAKAIEHIDAALGELHQALESVGHEEHHEGHEDHK